MSYQTKRILPDIDAIICLLDETIIERLNSHDTYKATSLLNQLWEINQRGDTTMFGLLEEVL